MVADVVEAMASHRPYRPALGVEAAIQELEDKKGILYSPEAVKACIAVLRKNPDFFSPAV
jgi:HD-GYP domain-containing protein (c-di-GMP phosphodiesterase class II)